MASLLVLASLLAFAFAQPNIPALYDAPPAAVPIGAPQQVPVLPAQATVSSSAPAPEKPKAKATAQGGQLNDPIGQAVGFATALLPDTSHAVASPVKKGMFKGLAFEGSDSAAEDAGDVVEGLIEGYMHKAEMTWEEKHCLRRKMSEATSNVIGATQEAIVAIQALFGPANEVLDKLEQETPLMLNAGVKVLKVVQDSKSLVGTCMNDDVMTTLETSAAHLKNMTYLKRRLLVNGVDIAEALSDSILAFDRKRFRSFGNDIGTALRKILLAKAGKVRHLPEGMPENKAVEEATEGLLRGLFADGTTISLTNSANASIHMQVDLYKCIARNQNFWKTVWEDAFTLVGKYGANPEEHGLKRDGRDKNRFLTKEGEGEVAGDVALALMQLPLALQQCNINGKTMNILGQSIRALKTSHLAFHIPGAHHSRKTTSHDIKVRVADAVDAWKDFDFYSFGKDLGYMLRDTLVLAFPREYSLDSEGRLFPSPRRSVAFAGEAVAFIAGLSLVTLGAVAAVRRVRRQDEMEPFMDVEMQSDAEDQVYVE